MSRSWLFATLPAAALGAIALVFAIRRLVRIHRSGFVARVALAPEQLLSLDSAGALVLHAEGPRFTRTFARLRYQLVERETGAEVPLRPILLRSTVAGMSNVRLSLHTFAIERPGAYLLRVEGLRPETATEGHSLVFTRNTRGASALAVLAIVVSALALIGSVVVTGIAVVSNQ